jgi:hypothetical protein
MPEDSINIKQYVDNCMAHTDEKIAGLRDLMLQHFQLNDRAVKLAEEALTIRLQSMNEFREQIKEERSSMATKEHLCALEDKLNLRIKPLETAHAFSAGKMWMVMAIFAAVPTVLALVALFSG